jgi:hypothetical protein
MLWRRRRRSECHLPVVCTRAPRRGPCLQESCEECPPGSRFPPRRFSHCSLRTRGHLPPSPRHRSRLTLPRTVGDQYTDMARPHVVLATLAPQQSSSATSPAGDALQQHSEPATTSPRSSPRAAAQARASYDRLARRILLVNALRAPCCPRGAAVPRCCSRGRPPIAGRSSVCTTLPPPSREQCQ